MGDAAGGPAAIAEGLSSLLDGDQAAPADPAPCSSSCRRSGGFSASTWKELDDDATRLADRSRPRRAAPISRPFVALAMCAVISDAPGVLRRPHAFRPGVSSRARPAVRPVPSEGHPARRIRRALQLRLVGGWRVSGYVRPLGVWKLVFKEDFLLDMGLRTRDFFKHAWISARSSAVVLPMMLLVSREPDFGSYYPLLQASSLRLLVRLPPRWEAMYFAQFFALGCTFRGFTLGVLRNGASARARSWPWPSRTAGSTSASPSSKRTALSSRASRSPRSA